MIEHIKITIYLLLSDNFQEPRLHLSVFRRSGIELFPPYQPWLVLNFQFHSVQKQIISYDIC